MGVFDVQASDIPAIRIAEAIGNGVEKNLLFVVGGGIGDRVCAEPTLRYAIDTFKDCKISLMCSTPELFGHLIFENVYTSVEDVPPKKHLVLHTYAQGNLSNQYFNANLMHSVDFASVSALRMQLPRNYKAIRLLSPGSALVRPLIYGGPSIVQDWRTFIIHPGESWPSRTLPAAWWDNLISSLCKFPYSLIVIVGNKTVPIAHHRSVIDLRERTTLEDLAWLCRHSDAVISNDSSPIHLAAHGRAKIAFVATCRPPDLIAHWRQSERGRIEFGWNTKDFSNLSNPMWKLFDHCPNNLNKVRIDQIPEGHKIEDFIQDPEEVINWIR